MSRREFGISHWEFGGNSASARDARLPDIVRFVMSEPAARVHFVAVLVFDAGQGRRDIEPHVFACSHPEIAYQLALARGGIARYGRTFGGLAELAVAVEDVPAVGKIEQGAARELVVTKGELSAFRVPRWARVDYDRSELAAALRRPPVLAELPGLGDVDWGAVSHAYGPALDVPHDLGRLASSDADVRAAALWQLSGSIYHQGDVFDSTAEAVPFLVMLASNPALPNRREILEFLGEIAASAAATNPEGIRKRWAERQARCPTLPYARPAAEMAEREIAAGLSVAVAMKGALGALRAICDDADGGVAESARAVVRVIEGTAREE